ncbi:hypothetical protein RJ641_035610, partial [Dillenia turbinata]
MLSRSWSWSYVCRPWPFDEEINK